MSTRSCIAYRTPTGFKGTYHHWDGYPRGVGAELLRRYRQDHNGDVRGMIRQVILDHPGGWSQLFTGTVTHPNCFCHTKEGKREDDSAMPLLTHKTASGSGVEYAYVLFTREGKNLMEVLSSYRQNGHKMMGMFGMGDPDASWRRIGLVDLDSPEEPEWDKMQA